MENMSSGRPNQELRYARRGRVRRRVYSGMLLFVVVAGLPIVAVPSLRLRLQTRFLSLRSALQGERQQPAPALAVVGENREPFPSEYERAQVPPIFPEKFKPAPARQPVQIVLGGSAAAPAAIPQTAAAGAPAAATQPAEESGSQQIQYRKGKTEQEAFDLLVNSSQPLAGMIKGSDPALKFQDWSAAAIGNDTYNVMVTFVQAQDNVVRQYIWTVKPMSKEVLPLNHYARSISR